MLKFRFKNGGTMGKINVGFIGLGCRGGDLMGTIIDFEDVNITAVCDK